MLFKTSNQKFLTGAVLFQFSRNPQFLTRGRTLIFKRIIEAILCELRCKGTIF